MTCIAGTDGEGPSLREKLLCPMCPVVPGSLEEVGVDLEAMRTPVTPIITMFRLLQTGYVRAADLKYGLPVVLYRYGTGIIRLPTFS